MLLPGGYNQFKESSVNQGVTLPGELNWAAFLANQPNVNEQSRVCFTPNDMFAAIAAAAGLLQERQGRKLVSETPLKPLADDCTDAKILRRLINTPFDDSTPTQPVLPPGARGIDTCIRAETLFSSLIYGMANGVDPLEDERVIRANVITDTTQGKEADPTLLQLEGGTHYRSQAPAITLKELWIGDIFCSAGSVVSLNFDDRYATEKNVSNIPLSAVKKARLIRLSLLALDPSDREPLISRAFKYSTGPSTDLYTTLTPAGVAEICKKAIAESPVVEVHDAQAAA